MYIAVTYENGNVFQHFGHSEQFKISCCIYQDKAVNGRVVKGLA